MTDTLLTHDAGVSAFEDAGGVVSTDDDGDVSFQWDEDNIVRVDAPADLTGVFDTDRFYKIEGATIARPIKQPYMVGDDIEWYKKPADELRQAAWSFDNAPFTLGHPDTGMVKDVADIHGFWRNPRYVDNGDRLVEDLYVPVSDDEALAFIEENTDVSVGFYNRVHADYTGDTGDLTDDDVDGFQVDMYGNHIAGVERGRCSGEDGCGLDDAPHGSMQSIEPSNQHTTVNTDHDLDYVIAPPTADYSEDGTYYAIAPDETDGGEPKYPINSCSDVDDAWKLRGHGDYSVSQSTLEDRIKSKARDLDCDVPGTEESEDSDCGCGSPDNEEDTMTDTNQDDDTDSFDIPDLSADAIADKNEAVAEIREERDSLKEQVDEMRNEIVDALDSAENFSVELEEDECPCEAVDELVSDLDEKAAEVKELSDELEEYKTEEKEERLDDLEGLGADREEWEEEALDDIEDEIDRREEVLDAAPDVSVKDIESETDEGVNEDTDDEQEQTINGTRTFGRGHNA